MIQAGPPAAIVIGVGRYHERVPTRQEAVVVSSVARLFRSLGDPTRLAILLALIDGERRVADVVELVGTSQPNVSGHLACLKECGLVVDRPAERRQVFYRIARPEVHDVLRAADRLVAELGPAIQACR